MLMTAQATPFRPRSTPHLALLDGVGDVGTNLLRTFCPGQGILKALCETRISSPVRLLLFGHGALVTYPDEVGEAPGDDGVVVECYIERYDAGGDADAAEVR